MKAGYELTDPEVIHEATLQDGSPVQVVVYDCLDIDTPILAPDVKPSPLRAGKMIMAISDQEVLSLHPVWWRGTHMHYPFYQQRAQRALRKVCMQAGVEFS